MTSWSGAHVTRRAVTSGAVLSLGAALVGPVAPAGAATFTVTNNGEGGTGSLRQAVLDANAAPGDDLITFGPGIGAINLYASVQITDGVTISGAAQAGLDVSGAFDITTTDAVTISGLTLTRSSFSSEPGH